MSLEPHVNLDKFFADVELITKLQIGGHNPPARLDSLRMMIQYIMLDTEASKREAETLRTLLREATEE